MTIVEIDDTAAEKATIKLVPVVAEETLKEDDLTPATAEVVVDADTAEEVMKKASEEASEPGVAVDTEKSTTTETAPLVANEAVSDSADAAQESAIILPPALEAAKDVVVDAIAGMCFSIGKSF